MPDTKGNLLKLLSARERQLFDLMVQGRSLTQIAALMGVSWSTVDIYRNRVMVKLDIYDQAGLVRFALGEVICRG